MNTILDGSKMLLRESLDVIGDSLNDIIIVGGWGPYLRHPDIHPGTKDVDMLFPDSYSKFDMSEVLERFLAQGFFISAKHDFQLCRDYQIGKQKYIYNVDLLHPTDGKMNKVDFIEMMNLDVTVDGIQVKKILSINIQFGKEIYSDNLFEKIDFEGRSFNVLDGAGIILSKINSCQGKKRPRDIYDIYLSLLEQNVKAKVTTLAEKSPFINAELQKYIEQINIKWPIYEESLSQFGIVGPESKQILLMDQT